MSGLKQSFVTKISDVNSTAQEPLGAIRIEGSRRYKYVEFKNATATVTAGVGTLVAYSAATGFANSRVVADLTDADAVPFAAGAMCGVIAGVFGTSYFGWVQTGGPATLDTAVTTGAAGKGFTLTTTDKTGTVAIAGDLAPYAGVSVDATTGVVLTCPM